MSRSPGAYCIFASRVAQRVSSGVEHGVMGVSEKSPSQRRPAMMRFLDSGSWKVVLEDMVEMRSDSAEEGEDIIFWVAIFQEMDSELGFRNARSSVERKPMSTRTWMN